MNTKLFPEIVLNWLDGAEKGAADGALFNNLSPASGQLLCQAVGSRQANVEKAVASVKKAYPACKIRLIISPSPNAVVLPEDYHFKEGQGTVLHPGEDAVLFAYGPVMLDEALKAAELLQTRGKTLKVVNLPWLNRVDSGWLNDTIEDFDHIFTLDNHASYGGIGDCLLNAMATARTLDSKRLVKFGVDGIAACGNPPEALHHHGVDGESLVNRIIEALKV